MAYEVSQTTDPLATPRKRYAYCLEAEDKRRNAQRDDLKFYAGSPDNGWQWPDKLKAAREGDSNGARPCLTINKLPSHIRQVTNEQRQNRPSVKVIPVDDKADVELAKQLDGVVRHIEYASDADVAYDTACEHQTIHGEGFWRVLTEYCDDKSFDQDIRIRRIRNPFTVHLDPDIQDPCGADARYGFIEEVLPEEEFKRLYPNTQAIDWEAIGRDPLLSQWYLSTERKVRIVEYFYVEIEQKKLFRWASGAISMEGEPLPQGVLAVEKPERTRTVEVKKVCWEKLSGQDVLQKTDWLGKYVPIIRVVGNELDVDGNVLVSGMVRNGKDPQRMYNYFRSASAEFLALQNKVPYVGYVGQFEGLEDKWKDANRLNYAYLEVNAVEVNGTIAPLPQRQAPPLPGAGFIQESLNSADDLKAVMGQFDASLGASGNEKSGKAIIARQRESDVSNFHYVDNLSRAIRHTGRILIDLIPKVYDTKRILRILGEDGEPDHIAVDPKAPQAVNRVVQTDSMTGEQQEVGKIYNPTIGQYDVRVIVGPSYTTKRQEAAEAMAQMVSNNPDLWKVIGDMLVKNMDWPGAEEMANRLKRIIPPEILGDGQKDASAQLAQAVQMIEAMKQEMGGMAEFAEQLQAALADQKAALEAQKQANEETKLSIQAYDAETKRMKELAPVMTPEQIQELVVATVQGLLTQPDISGVQG